MAEGYVGRSLDDGIVMETTENFIKLAVPKSNTPRQRAVKLKDAKRGIYMVPKTDLFCRAQEKLADGSTLVIMRYRKIPRAEREAMHAAATAKGLKMEPLEAEKSDSEGYATRISIDDLK